MPLAVKIFPDLELIWVRGTGIVSDGELEEYVEEYLVRQGLRKFGEVFDLSRADLLDVTYIGLSRVAAAAAPTDPADTPTQIGILVSETVGIGVSRMYQTLRETKGGRRNLRIFRDIAPLREWMRIPEDLEVDGKD